MNQEERLVSLRSQMEASMSPKRFRHTFMVEEMVARLCRLFCPETEFRLRTAALLHDMTKEKPAEEHFEILRSYGIEPTEMDALAPKTLHARTAALLIPTRFPELADPITVQAVRWHTTGHVGMTLTEKLLYLADYIDDSRTYPNCVTLRNFFWEKHPEEMDAKKREALLRNTLILSFDMTIRDLLEEGLPIASDTVGARDELILERARFQERK